MYVCIGICIQYRKGVGSRIYIARRKAENAVVYKAPRGETNPYSRRP